MEHAQRLESLGILAGGIAHDFNNLLAVIMASAGLAERCMDQPGMVQDGLTRIISASQRAAELCKQMMSYAGRGDYKKKTIDLSEMVTSISDLLRMSISHNITVKHELAPMVLHVDADGSQLQQVIMNLVINASEAIGESEAGLIRIKTGQMMADREYLKGAVSDSGLEAGEYCYLEISDNGCGMSSKVKTHLFDPFFTTKFTGRGLGMSAILGIVRSHQGVIFLDSEEGVGSSIRVLLPNTNRSQQRATVPSSKKQHSDWQGYGTALVVDDEPDIRDLATFLMKDMGFDVIQAEDGLAALELFRQHQHDITIVILDLAMPNMNGEACFRELRKIQSDIKIILSSGYSKGESFSRFSDKGLFGFVQKPYKPEAFEAEVQALCQHDQD